MAKRWGKSEKQSIHYLASFDGSKKSKASRGWGDQERKYMNKSFSLQEIGSRQQNGRAKSSHQRIRKQPRTLYGERPDAWDRPRTGVTMANSISREQASKVCNSLMKDVPTQKMLSANDNTSIYDTTKCYNYLKGANYNGVIGLRSKVTRSKATRVANSILRDVPVQRSTMGINPEDEHFGDDLFESQASKISESSTYSLKKKSSTADKISNSIAPRPRNYTRSPFEQGALAYDVDRGEKYLQRNRNSASMRSLVSREKSSEIANSVLKDIPMKRAYGRQACQQGREYDIDRCDRYLQAESNSGGCYTMRSTVSRNDATSVANSLLKDVPMKQAEKAFIIDSMGGMTSIILSNLDSM